MFKKHSVQMKLVKDSTEVTNDYDKFVDGLYAVEMTTNDLIRNAVKAAITIIGVKTASELTLHIAKTYIK